MFRKNFFIIGFLCFVQLAFAQKKDDVLGKWVNPSGEGQVEIYKKSERYFGKLVWLKEPDEAPGKPKLDIKNPNANLRNKPLLGLEILKDFVFEDGRWTDGTIYDPKTGKTYSCNLTLKNGQLGIRGYVGISLIGRSEVWRRVK